jgi:hypothetical protein
MWYPDLIAVSTALGATAAVAVAFRWFRHREHLAALAATHEPAGAMEARLRRLEGQVERVTEAVDAVAVEMERVGEGQRFLAAQLADRTAASGPPPVLPSVPPPARPTAVPAHGRIVTPR